MSDTTQVLTSPIQVANWHEHQRSAPSRFKVAAISVLISSKNAVASPKKFAEIEPLFNELLATYEIFRTGYYTNSQGIVEQCINSNMSVEYQYHPQTSGVTLDLDAFKQGLFDSRCERDLATSWLAIDVVELDGDTHWVSIMLPTMNADLFTLKQLMQMLLLATQNGRQAVLQQLSDEEVQYSDIAYWLSDFLINDELEEARQYWQTEQFHATGADKFHLRNYLDTGTAGWKTKELDLCESLHPLKDLAQHLGVVLSDVIASVLRQVIQQCSESAIMTRLLDSRIDEALFSAMGPLSRSVPMHYQTVQDIHVDAGAEMAARALSQDYLECYIKPDELEHQYFPFAFSHLEWQDSADVQLDEIHYAAEPTKVDFCFVEGEQKATIQANFDTSYINEQALHTLFSKIERQISRCITNAQQNTPSSFFQLNGPEANYATNDVVSWFESIADSHSGKVTSVKLALAKEPLHSESFSQINKRANQLAHWLIEQGIEKGDLIAINMLRSVEFVIALLACGKAGAAYLPLDEELPQARVQDIVEEAKPALILSQHALELEGCRQVRWCDIDLEQQAQTALNITRQPEDLAYLLFTSGSTGKPKGVAISHRALNNHMQWMLQEFDFKDSHRFLQRTSAGFDASVWEFWAPMLCGGDMIIAEKALTLNAVALQHTLIEHSINVMQIVPSMLEVLLDEPDLEQFPTLSYLFCGGEQLTNATAQAALKQFDCEVINLYGPSECCIDSTFWRFDAALNTNAVPIGMPIDNNRCRVVKADGSIATPGEDGELWIGGAGVFSGYLGQEQMTRDATWYDEEDGLYYRSGDQVRVLPDGNLFFLTRNDNQIKLNGLRIELSEITELLRNRSLAEQVQSVYDNEYKSIYLFVLDQKSASNREIQTTLAAHLPEYMQPQKVVRLERFPTLSNGKLDQKALIAQARDSGETNYQPPKSDTEIRLYQLWQEVLSSQNRFGINEDFFALGGHSLMAMKLMGKISRSFNIDINVRDLFAHRNIKQLADFVDSQGSRVQQSIEQTDKTVPVFLSHQQQRLWLIDMMEGGSPQYNMPVAFELKGQLDVQALQLALNAVVERHTILRSTYHEENGTPYQSIQPLKKVPLRLESITEAPIAQRLELIAELVAAEAGRVFKLHEDVLLRACLIAVAEDHHVLLFTLHHIAADGWSMNTLAQEFASLYDSFTADKNADALSALPPLSAQYADYAHWQRQHCNENYLGEQLAFWKGTLDGLPPVHSLPLDKVRPEIQKFNGASRKQLLSQSLLESLTQLANSQGSTLFMCLQAAFSLFLCRWSNVKDIAVGSPIAGRNSPDVESLIGFFVNTLVFRTRLDQEMSFLQLLEQNKRYALQAYANQDVPFEMLVDELQPARSTSHSPLFQILFSLQDDQQASLSMADLEVFGVAEHNHIVRFDLELTAAQLADGLVLNWGYATSLFHADTIELMSKSFELFLQQLVSNPEASVFSLPLLPKYYQDELLTPPQPAENNLCLHELFEQQVTLNPNKPAASDLHQEFSYAELNTFANNVAVALEQKGVKAGDLVGLCCRRDVSIVAAILGILKCGAAYVPMDPTYPKARLQAITEDSDIRVVVNNTDTVERLNQDTQSGLFSSVEQLLLDTVSRDHSSSELKWQITRAAIHPDNLAYVIYTSGSTGKPKGVKIRHRNAVAMLRWAERTYLAQELKKTLASTSCNFDLSVFEMFAPLCFGYQCVVVESALTLVADAQHDSLKGITFINTVPSAVRLLLNSQAIPDSVSTVNLAGEPLDGPLVNQLLALPHCHKVYNLYGPSEDTTYSTGVCFTQPLFDAPSIGKPIDHTQALVLSSEGQLLPKGSVGELYLGGAGVSAGYLNQESLTREQFVYSPWDLQRENVLYKTGDLVKYLPDGNLQYVGRIDHMVKLRGFRIELGEIQHAFVASPLVAEAQAMVVDNGDNPILAAFITATGMHKGSNEDLESMVREFVSEQLPAYMLPNHIIVLSQFPLTANGKVDKSVLLEMLDNVDETEHLEAPTTETENRILAMWSKVLGKEVLGTNINFFTVGGNSLRLTRLYIEIKREFGLDITLKSLFSRNTVKSQAELVDAHHLINPNFELNPSAEDELIEEEF
ncbi:non-ribosomal peptide synthetase [Pseudoalteromonas sp. TB41]|uniref:non-ribosomal peptide synthetase n=1 Tax=Pseudoalteromonas sp. TB41 TaxID=985149 RepID=UPI000405915B|nr:non-ribosomal peptide synthetase [Pseudoalteromonas sp. TB41]